ncbi:putative serine/threonine protein kinase [Halenospora varia]|nr:putative serine/threonine protein kinase [Halenospora varia]
MSTPRYLFQLDLVLIGKSDTYRITKQLSEFVYFAANIQEKSVVIKSVEGHWRLYNERDVLRRLQGWASTIRPLLDEIKYPVKPPVIVLKYLDDDITRALRKQKLTRQEIKYVAKNVLRALAVLHEDGYVHTDIKPSNIMVNYGPGPDRFSDVELADFGGTVLELSEAAKECTQAGTSVFRAPEVHLEIPWGTKSDIWSFGVTSSFLINLLMGIHIFEPESNRLETDPEYNVEVIVRQHQHFVPFPSSYQDFLDGTEQMALHELMARVPIEKMRPFNWLQERQICKADKDFVVKIMKLDPRDRPSAAQLLQDEWFTEKTGRIMGYYLQDKWLKLHPPSEQTKDNA